MNELERHLRIESLNKQKEKLEEQLKKMNDSKEQENLNLRIILVEKHIQALKENSMEQSQMKR